MPKYRVTGTVKLQVWTDVKAGSPEEARGEASLRDVHLRLNDDWVAGERMHWRVCRLGLSVEQKHCYLAPEKSDGDEPPVVAEDLYLRPGEIEALERGTATLHVRDVHGEGAIVERETETMRLKEE